ncbi:C39 family peptidase [Anaerotardibacter muris]|uniref:C39 family peptidase n=1 Tax=Anaerotardibacter muris TaxID=2941505 RepID=UPI00203F3503|nr:C39 family peptidase [Anaerotardibacter muris]
MQQNHSNERPNLWHDVPTNRFSRKSARYRARPIFRQQQDLFARLFPTVLLVLATVFVLIAGFLTVANGACSSADAASAEEGQKTVQPVKSTARDQWIRGKMPYLYQIDAEWAATPYAGGTVADSGCGPTCLSMVYVCLTGKKDKDPAQMAAFSTNNGYIDCGMTSWMFMTDGAARLGLSSRELPADESVIRRELDAGHPIIASVSPGDFTEKGHFIVLAGTDAFGRILVRDPNSAERSAQAWDLSRILSQTRNLWSFSY